LTARAAEAALYRPRPRLRTTNHRGDLNLTMLM
jgi:hypothetical protein